MIFIIFKLIYYSTAIVTTNVFYIIYQQLCPISTTRSKLTTNPNCIAVSQPLHLQLLYHITAYKVISYLHSSRDIFVNAINKIFTHKHLVLLWVTQHVQHAFKVLLPPQMYKLCCRRSSFRLHIQIFTCLCFLSQAWIYNRLGYV